MIGGQAVNAYVEPLVSLDLDLAVAAAEVLGLRLPLAALEDVLTRKVWAAAGPTRRASRRQKDLADIARLVEAYPRRPADAARLESDRRRAP